jgi:uncharacterized protein (TIGR02266 family)
MSVLAETAAEKRKSLRVPVTLTAHCRIGNRFLREPVGNLSTTGLYLRTRERVKEGTPVRVALALPHEDGPRFCTLVGSVARIDKDSSGTHRGVGVCFTTEQISFVDRSHLEAFVSVRASDSYLVKEAV